MTYCPKKLEVFEMPRTLPASGLPEGFGYEKHPELRKWMESEYPLLDPEKTMTRFIDYAQDAGRMATIWTACFKRVIRTGVEKKYDGIVTYREGRAADPAWSRVMSMQADCGFRQPFSYESQSSYEREMQKHIEGQKRAPVVDLFAASALKRMGT